MQKLPNLCKMRVSLVLLFSLFCCAVMAQQNIRISYAFLSKSDVSEAKYKAHMDMKLEVSGPDAFFYSEEMFLADSLSAIAFGNDGGIADLSAYEERGMHSSANTELYHIDFSSGSYQSYYRLINNVFIGKKEPLDFPAWVLVDSTKTFGGYNCKKAEAEYMGRQWSVWYTEEISVNAGPWLLFGAPGLIVYASDSDNLFNFYILNQEYIPESRLPLLEKNYLRNAKVQRISVKDLETVKTRANRDLDYMKQLMGVGSTTVRDRNGNMMQDKRFRKYQPLTSESYWK